MLTLGTGSKPPCQPQRPLQSRRQSSRAELWYSRLEHDKIRIALRLVAESSRRAHHRRALSSDAQRVRQAPQRGLHGWQRERQQALAPLGILARRLSLKLRRSRLRCRTAD